MHVNIRDKLKQTNTVYRVREKDHPSTMNVHAHWKVHKYIQYMDNIYTVHTTEEKGFNSELIG